eukprot:gnl/TRDRNA2_/TRDRNA2_193794_c0_seq1.p1 gnl/TRDRNA2_/TRDRNA2_193794_c0~~gnl/TRDRNA2_/TRDRNA2_193794_c0_seq1.p1  ORF type:complete len:158 (-),score=26.13 gnl/TRDRNA2_/TRDRNA2_193794_c0_seq1:17-490(-)
MYHMRTLLLMIAVGTNKGIAGRLRFDNATHTDRCLEGFEGDTEEARCQALLDSLRIDVNMKEFLQIQRDEDTSDDACSSLCEESDKPAVGHDGQFNEVKCCKTVYRRLAYYKSTLARCERKRRSDHEVPCWVSVHEYLPRYIEHYEGLKAECDAKCK